MVEVVRGAGVLRRGEVGGRSYSGAGPGAIYAASRDYENGSDWQRGAMRRLLSVYIYPVYNLPNSTPRATA